MRSLSAPDAAILFVGVAACVTDYRSRRIPNVLTFGASLAAVLFFWFTAGLAGIVTSAEGWIVGCLLFLPWFALGGMGGGDVKLLAALGAWAGPGQAVWMRCTRGLLAACLPSRWPSDGVICGRCSGICGDC